jgi:hypothetical protein
MLNMTTIQSAEILVPMSFIPPLPSDLSDGALRVLPSSPLLSLNFTV